MYRHIQDRQMTQMADTHTDRQQTDIQIHRQKTDRQAHTDIPPHRQMAHTHTHKIRKY